MTEATPVECVHCRAPGDPRDRFCARCGAARGVTVAPSEERAAPSVDGYPEASDHPRPPGRARWHLALAVLVNIGLLVGSALLVHQWLERRATGRHRARPAAAGKIALGAPRLTPARQVLTEPPDWPSWWRPEPSKPRTKATQRTTKAKPRRKGPGPGKPKPGRTTRLARPTTADGAAHPAEVGRDAAVAIPRPAPDADASLAGDAADPAGRRRDEVRGRLNAGSIRLVVRHHLPQIRLCYDRALKRRPTLAGQVDIRLVVDADGRAKTAEVHRNTTGHDGLGKCIAYTMQRWRYPRPVGGVETDVIYPFAFSAAAPGAGR